MGDHSTLLVNGNLSSFGIAPGSILTEGTRALFYSEENKERAESLMSHIALVRRGGPDDIAGRRSLPCFRQCKVHHLPRSERASTAKGFGQPERRCARPARRFDVRGRRCVGSRLHLSKPAESNGARISPHEFT
jgi:hypothetical protein